MSFVENRISTHARSDLGGEGNLIPFDLWSFLQGALRRPRKSGWGGEKRLFCGYLEMMCRQTGCSSNTGFGLELGLFHLLMYWNRYGDLLFPRLRRGNASARWIEEWYCILDRLNELVEDDEIKQAVLKWLDLNREINFSLGGVMGQESVARDGITTGMNYWGLRALSSFGFIFPMIISLHRRESIEAHSLDDYVRTAGHLVFAAQIADDVSSLVKDAKWGIRSPYLQDLQVSDRHDQYLAGGSLQINSEQMRRIFSIAGEAMAGCLGEISWPPPIEGSIQRITFGFLCAAIRHNHDKYGGTHYPSWLKLNAWCGAYRAYAAGFSSPYNEVASSVKAALNGGFRKAREIFWES